MKNFSKLSFLLLSTILLFNACKKDDPTPEDENELISQVKIEFTDSLGQQTYSWKNGKSDTINLAKNQKYTTKVYFYSLDKEQNNIDITNEISEENDQHQLFYTTNPSDLLSTTYEDQDINGLPLGLSMSMMTTNESKTGTLRIQLKHYAVEKDGKPTSGSTDADINFNVKIQ